MRYYLYIAMLLILSAVTLKALGMDCQDSGVGARDLNELDKRYEIDQLFWITFIESILALVMVNKRYRNVSTYAMVFFLTMRLNEKGILDTCIPSKNCPVESETVFDYIDYCGTNTFYSFEHLRFWSNPQHLCIVPDYYTECRNPVHNTNQTRFDPLMRLKNVPNLYKCYVWGCSYQITPIRYCFKWFTTLLSCLSLLSVGWESASSITTKKLNKLL